MEEECELIVKIDAAPLTNTLLLIQQDPMSLTAVTEPRGFSLSAEVREDGFSKARPVNATLIEPYPISNATDCNNSYSMKNDHIAASLLSCSKGKLVLNVT